MFGTPDANLTGGSPYTRESSANSDGVCFHVLIPRSLINFLFANGQARGGPRALFSLPNGEPASFLLHNFENADLTRRIIVSSSLLFYTCLVRTPSTGAGWSDH